MFLHVFIDLIVYSKILWKVIEWKIWEGNFYGRWRKWGNGLQTTNCKKYATLNLIQPFFDKIQFRFHFSFPACHFFEISSSHQFTHFNYCAEATFKLFHLCNMSSPLSLPRRNEFQSRMFFANISIKTS